MIKEKGGKSGKSEKKNGDEFLLVFLGAILSFVILYSKKITENPD
jgi:hypothetical protein